MFAVLNLNGTSKEVQLSAASITCGILSRAEWPWDHNVVREPYPGDAPAHHGVGEAILRKVPPRAQHIALRSE